MTTNTHASVMMRLVRHLELACSPPPIVPAPCSQGLCALNHTHDCRRVSEATARCSGVFAPFESLQSWWTSSPLPSQPTVPRSSSWGTVAALPYPILLWMSRLPSAVLHLAGSHQPSWHKGQ